MSDCQHPVLVQYLDGTKVKCSLCLTESVDLMQVQDRQGGQTWKLIMGFLLERHRGSMTSARDFFGLTERGLAPKAAQVADGLGRT